MEIGMLRRMACVFFLPLVVAVAARGEAELGSWVLKDGGGGVSGVEFRVWSPNAVAVAVVGDFNGWDVSADPLVKDVGTDVWSVTVPEAGPGDAYKYAITTGGEEVLFRKDPRAREVRTMDDGTQAGVVYDTGAFVWEDGDFQPGFPNEIVMYEMHIGTFYDPRPDDGEPATFYDAAQRLDYLEALGVNMIALMPVSEFNGRHSWGYNPIALFAIEQAYGGPDGLKHFVNEAHKRGMAVQVDVVHNHYGDLAASGASDLENFDGGEPYFYNAADDVGRPGISRTKWGPRPRYIDANVREFIKDNVRMYLDEYKIWALRWDSPRNITGYDSEPGIDVGDPDTGIPEAVTMMEEINAEIAARNPRYYSIAEDADSDGGYSGHWEISFHNVLFPRLLPLTGNGTLPEPFEGRLEFPMLNTRNATNIGYRLETKEQPGFRVIFSENHDKCGDLNSATDGARLAQDFDPADPTSYAARKKSMLASAVTLTSAGTPMLFQGQEQLADGFFDAYVRLDWLRAGGYPEMVRFHRDAIGLRRNLDGVSEALTYTSLPEVDDLTGVTEVNLVNEDEGWMSYVRRTGEPGGSVVVSVNFSGVERTVGVDFPEAGDWVVLLNSDAGIYGADFGDVGPAMGASIGTSGPNNYATFQVAPWSVVVFGKSAGPVPVADADGDGMDDGWEMLFGVNDASGDGDADGFGDLSEYLNGTDPTVADFAALPGTFNDWNITSPVLRWDAGRGVWRHVARFGYEGRQECKAYLADGWVGGGNHGFDVVAGGATYEITYDPATGVYGTTRVDADGDGDGMADAWEAFWFYPAAGVEAGGDPDGDGFTNLEEFQRGSDPTEFDHPAMGVVGGHNGWNWNARNMRYTGHGVWTAAIPFASTPGDRNYKFGVGPTADDANWGQPVDGNPGGFKSDVDFQWPAEVLGWRLVRFNEKNFAVSVSTLEGAVDRDSDGMPDDWEIAFGLDPAVGDGGGDIDGDTVTNLFEYGRVSNPLDASDHYAAMNMPGSGYWGWGESDASTAMAWNPSIARWEFVFRATGAFSFEFKVAAGNYTNGTWGWVDGVGVVGESVKWANGNIQAGVDSAGWWVVRFEEISGDYEIAALEATDSDGDGMPDEWERFYGLDPAVADTSGDIDGDRVRDVIEFARLSDPRVIDYSSVMHMPRTGDWGENSAGNAMAWSDAAGLWECVLFLPRSGAGLEFKFVAGNYSVGTWGWNGTGEVGQAEKWANENIVHTASGRGHFTVLFEEFGATYAIVALDEADADGDGMPDAWERYHGFDTADAADALFDADADGVANLLEYVRGGKPRVADHYGRMTVVGALNGWTFDVSPMRWNGTTGKWELLVDAGGASGAQEMKFNAGSSWDDDDWGDDEGDGIGNANNGTNISYDVPAGTRFLFFSFDEITLDYVAGPMSIDDSDSDGLPDAWATWHGVSGSSGNPDGDPFTNAEEYARGSDPNVYDEYVTDHAEMRVVGSFQSWEPELAPQMELVGDNLWQGDVGINDPDGVQFKFIAGSAWGAPDWGSTDGSNGGNLLLPAGGAGTWRFTFNDSTLEWSAAPVVDLFGEAYPDYGAGGLVRGMPALVEYLFGGTQAQAPDAWRLPVTAIVDGVMQVSFTTRTDDADLAWVVESTDDLVNGSWVAVEEFSSAIVSSTARSRVYRMPLDGDRLFWRVRVLHGVE